MVLTRHTYMFDFEVSSTAIDTMGQFQLKKNCWRQSPLSSTTGAVRSKVNFSMLLSLDS